MPRTIRRKLGTLARNPYAALRSAWWQSARFARKRRGKRWLWQRDARRRLRRAGVLETVAAFQEARPGSAFGADYCDLLFLYDLVRERRPSLVLEFGSGLSTAVIAHALRANGEGRIVSVDADEEWARSTAEAIPPALKACADVRFGAALPAERKGTLGWVHENVPRLAPDIVYVDGPALTPERRASFDVLDLEESLPAGAFVVVDGRAENAALLDRELARPHRMRARRGYDNFVIELG